MTYDPSDTRTDPLVISPRMGRVLSATGALLLAGGLFVTWYHIHRGGGVVEPATGFETFTRLRVVILAGAVVLLLSALVPQSQPVLVARTLVGLVLGLLILRRVVFPPDLADPVTSQLGMFAGVVGAICAVLGGVVDSGREVAERYSATALWRERASEPGGGSVIGSTAEEVR